MLIFLIFLLIKKEFIDDDIVIEYKEDDQPEVFQKSSKKRKRLDEEDEDKPKKKRKTQPKEKNQDLILILDKDGNIKDQNNKIYSFKDIQKLSNNKQKLNNKLKSIEIDDEDDEIKQKNINEYKTAISIFDTKKKETYNNLMKIIIFLMCNTSHLRSETFDLVLKLRCINKTFNNLINNPMIIKNVITNIQHHDTFIKNTTKKSPIYKKNTNIYFKSKLKPLLKEFSRILKLKLDKYDNKQIKILWKSFKIYYYFNENWPQYKIQKINDFNSTYGCILVYNKNSKEYTPLFRVVKSNNDKEIFQIQNVFQNNVEFHSLNWNKIQNKDFIKPTIKNIPKILYYDSTFLSDNTLSQYIKDADSIITNLSTIQDKSISKIKSHRK